MRKLKQSRSKQNQNQTNQSSVQFREISCQISALLSTNAGKYKFLSGKDVLPETDLLETAATIKTFEYSPLGSKLKKAVWHYKRSIEFF